MLVKDCPECQGEGEIETEVAIADYQCGGYLRGVTIECYVCGGSGEVEEVDVCLLTGGVV